MKVVLNLVILGFVFFGQAQKNVFLDRFFWDENTSVETVKTAIKKGNSPTAFNNFNFDATVYAILEDAPLATIEYLLTFKENNVQKITHDARNYLMWAGYKGNYPLVMRLLEMGSDTKIIDDAGHNILTFTALGGTLNHRIYTAYKKFGRPLNTPNRKGATIIHYLVQNIDDIKALDFFLEQGLVLKAKDKNNNTVFHYAASQGNLNLLKALISKGFDATAKNLQQESALFFAARGKRGHQNEIAVFQFLEAQEINLKATNTSGSNVLHYLVRNNKNKAVYEFLIGKELGSNKVNKEGNTPLLLAVKYNNSTAIDILFPQSKDYKVKNAKGHSMLTYALRNQNKKLIDQLLDKDLSIYIVDEKGNNLITHLVDTYSSDHRAFFKKQFDFLQHQDVNIQAQTLHLATVQESEYLISFLIDNGADINAQNEKGMTALQLAAMKGNHPDFLKFLIQKGADTSITTEFGETVYELAKNNEQLTGNLNFLK